MVGTDVLWAEGLYSLSATPVLPVGSSLDLEKRGHWHQVQPEEGPVGGVCMAPVGASRDWDDGKSPGGSCFFLDVTPGRPGHHSLSNTDLEILTGFLCINRFQLLGPALPLSELLPSDALYFGSKQK